ncbi:hypothetical protein H4S08_000699 [Coemansia sp. RSA 1365]|nr:hypothetical protein H4S08_000699 [Coemansia sp. RSA 1365]
MLSSSSDAGTLVGEASDQLQPQSASVTMGMYIYELHVVQQPLRARMCGFGEKDRRPCTPPPILQLVVYDRFTRQPIDVDNIDPSFFIATCSLFSVDGKTAMDLIHQRGPNDSGHGSTSSETVQQLTQSEGDLLDGTYYSGGTEMGIHLSTPPPTATDPAADSALGISHTSKGDIMEDNMDDVQPGTSSQRTAFLGQNAASSASIMSFSAYFGPKVAQTDEENLSGCVVRNLIGSGVAAGAKLNDLDGSLGIFFVFPDLSIRKDGEYRLRFSYFNLQAETGELITTSTHIQAYTFSEPFRVYSAKQFPGMIESTALSKHFAKQGVKIPVRKESIKAE